MASRFAISDRVNRVEPGEHVITVLCLEDQAELARQVEELAYGCFGSNLVFTVAKDVASAKKEVQRTTFDIALIDIQVPFRAGEIPHATGGLLFLDHVLSSVHANRPRYLAGITTDRQAFEKADSQFSSSMFTLVQRDVGSTEWLGRLTRFFSYVESVSVKDEGTRQGARRSGEPTLLVVCALHKKELVPSMEAFPSTHWTLIEDGQDPTSCFKGTVMTRSGQHTVLAAAAHEPGAPVAAALTARLIQKFKPKIVAMTGIAAATSKDCGFGDILFGEHIWDYTTGKATQEGLRPEVRSVKCDAMVLDQSRQLALDSPFINSVMDEWPGPKPATRLQVHFGPITSGGAVIEDEAQVKRVLARDRKTIGLDMEAYGVAVAAWYSERPSPPVLIAKSVVDHAVPPKTDQWHEYAAYTSARFLSEWANRFL
jgi:nucleoside phosphorylase